jgi:hypothetical protein
MRRGFLYVPLPFLMPLPLGLAIPRAGVIFLPNCPYLRYETDLTGCGSV